MTPATQTKPSPTQSLKHLIQTLIAAGMVVAPMAHAQTATDIQTDELRRAADRARQIQDQQPKSPDVRIEPNKANNTPNAPQKPSKPTLQNNEPNAFTIRHIELTGKDAHQFQFALRHALKQLDLRAVQSQTGETLILTNPNNATAGKPNNLIEGVPIGANGINTIMSAVQNAIIDKGYTTTRVLAEPQDLKSGTLKLTVMAGRVRHIQFDQTNSDKTHISRAHSFNALPIREGDILNLRDIEMGLENLKRPPTVEADIKVSPADKPNESDLVITWAQKTNPLRFNLTLDDTGGNATGKYQAGGTISFDNPFTLNDMLYVSYGRDAFGYDKVGSQHGDTQNWNGHYAVPFGYWNLDVNASSYHYNQAVAGASQTYTYSGHSRTADIKLSKMLYRDSHRKTTAFIKGWQRYSDNYIDDAQIDVQTRQTAGLEFGLSHKEYLGNSTLDLGMTYKRGTGAQNARRAPEELFGEGTSRMKILTADIGLTVPFKALKHDFTFSTNTHAQWHKTPLLSQDKLAIGGRSTVRGFDGSMTLSAERGVYSRNELAVIYAKSHQVYIAVDGGHVAGASAPLLLGQTLIGGAVGVRGQFKAGGDLSYDGFVGAPIKKPQGFKTANATFGFNLSYSF